MPPQFAAQRQSSPAAGGQTPPAARATAHTPRRSTAKAAPGAPAAARSGYWPVPISNTAEYGDYVTGPKIVTAETKKAMKKILSDIQDGTFAKEFLLDMSPAGRQVHFKAMRKLASEHPSEKVGEEIRKLYSWNDESDKLINN